MRIQIREPQLLGDVCKRVLRWEQRAADTAAAYAPRRHGSGLYARAAWRLGISPAQLWNLSNGSTGRALNQRVFHALHSYLPPSHVSEHAVRRWEKDLDRALWTPAAAEAFRTYIRWLRRELRRYGAQWRDGWPIYRAKGSDLYSVAWRLLAELRRRYPEEFAPLEKRASQLAKTRGWQPDHQPGRVEYAAHLSPAQRAVLAELTRSPNRYLTISELRRLDLAYLRIVEPILVGESSGGVELTPEELGKELPAYLRAAVKREVLLLQRSPDLARIQRSPSRG